MAKSKNDLDSISHFDDWAHEGHKKSRLAKDRNDYNKAKALLRQDPKNMKNIAGAGHPKGKEFRNAQIEADKHNEKHKTKFQAKDQAKINNAERIGTMKSHAHLDTKSGTVYGDKPVNERQRDSLNSFKSTGRNLTQVKKKEVNKGGISPLGQKNKAQVRAAAKKNNTRAASNQKSKSAAAGQSAIKNKTASSASPAKSRVVGGSTTSKGNSTSAGVNQNKGKTR